jgi:hypothetical protein
MVDKIVRDNKLKTLLSGFHLARVSPMRLGLLVLAVLSILSITVLFLFLNTAAVNKEKPIVVIRVDDIQDYAFREAQLFLLNDSIKNQFPFSLAVIPGMFGQDEEVVQAVRSAVNFDCEVTAHGWMHEDLSTLSVETQLDLLNQARTRISQVLNYDTEAWWRPCLEFNQETILAMQQANYR